MPHINVGLLHDVGDAYYYSRWGGTGLCHRYPLLHPKISYVAYATLTRELDGAKFVRYLTSHSLSLYIMEFHRGDELVLSLMDFAPPIDPAKVQPRDLDDVRPGGLGTFLIREVMDSAEFVEPPPGCGNLLRMVKRIE